MRTIPVFFFTPKGKSGIKAHPHNVTVRTKKQAQSVTRAFYNGTMHKVWDMLDDDTKSRFGQLKIDPNDCVNGELGVSTSALKEYAPHLR